jgi:hypothetical protein
MPSCQSPSVWPNSCEIAAASVDKVLSVDGKSKVRSTATQQGTVLLQGGCARNDPIQPTPPPSMPGGSV